jgi:hypothetical protein
MSIGISTRVKRRVRLIFSAVTLGISLTCFLHSYSSNAQTAEKVRSIQSQFFQEGGCPVAVTATRAELDLDPFDAPLDARIYLTYRNISDRPVDAVKFRIRLSDNYGKDLGTFHAPDEGILGAGQERTQKWKRDRVYPSTTTMQIRVLQARFSDGTMWNSTKMQELLDPHGGGTPPAPPATDGAPPANPGTPQSQ